MVNNAIHPGEPCELNASFALAAQWLKTPTTVNHPLSKSSWVFVPQYNVGGASRKLLHPGESKTAGSIWLPGGTQQTLT